MISPLPERPASLYEELADLIEKNKVALARQMAEEVFSDNVTTYSERGVQALATQFEPHYTMMANYTREGDPDLWQKYFSKLVIDRKNEGFGIDAVLRTSHFYYKVVFDLIEREFGEAVNQPKRDKFRRRINGLKTLSETTARVAYLSSK
jgi:hypothetical protein